MTEWASGLYAGKVMHRRLKPKRHDLRYRMFWLLLDLDELDALDKATRIFSRNHFNLFSFFDRDHLDGSPTPLRDQIECHLRSAGIEPDGGAIRVAALPRILGYVFNPLSVYYCHARDGRLLAMLYEVNNTFGERHSYLIPVDENNTEPIVQSCAKELHVSPFMDLALSYDFRVTVPGASLSVSVNARDKDGVLLATSFSGNRVALSDSALLRAFFGHPLLTLKVLLGIHWEALKIWLKGVKIRPKPSPPLHAVTVVSSNHVKDMV